MIMSMLTAAGALVAVGLRAVLVLMVPSAVAAALVAMTVGKHWEAESLSSES